MTFDIETLKNKREMYDLDEIFEILDNQDYPGKKRSEFDKYLGMYFLEKSNNSLVNMLTEEIKQKITYEHDNNGYIGSMILPPNENPYIDEKDVLDIEEFTKVKVDSFSYGCTCMLPQIVSIALIEDKERRDDIARIIFGPERGGEIQAYSLALSQVVKNSLEEIKSDISVCYCYFDEH